MKAELTNIFITSGVNERDEPFCTVAAHGADGTILVGQLSPAEVRAHAMAYLGAAEGADQDAAVMRVIHELDLPVELAAAVVVELRQMRDDDR